MSRRAWLSRRSVRGVTLLELLVVIGIILAITAAVIPVMAPAMAGRRLREASRGVNTFISSARNKALATGRSVGVAFERLEAEAQASTVLTLVEAPPPWSGDNVESKMLVRSNGRIVGFSTASEIGWQIAKVRPGDIIKFNFRNTAYRLVGPTDPFAAEPTDMNPWLFVHDDPRMSNVAPRIGQANPSLPPTELPFQITRAPALNSTFRSAAASYQLPVGTVVDLSVSGSDDIPTYGRFGRVELNDVAAVKSRPVMILFGPNGSLERVTYETVDSSNTPTLVSFRPTAALQFLVGRRDGVGIGPDTVQNTPVDELPNWRDLDNFWISIYPQSGLIISNPNAQIDPTFSVRSSTVDPPPNDATVDPNKLENGLGQARAFARQGQSMGGR
jgi:type II secretory pathway pseudopilin PulG